MNQGSSEYWHEVARLLDARRRYAALCAGGTRVQIPTQDDSKFYTFLRILEGARTMLVLLNFQAESAEIEIDFSKLDYDYGREIWAGDSIELRGRQVTFSLPSYGYLILEIQ